MMLVFGSGKWLCWFSKILSLSSLCTALVPAPFCNYYC
jgi:hypothetical protein